MGHFGRSEFMSDLCLNCGEGLQYEDGLCVSCYTDKLNADFERAFERFKEERENGTTD